MRLEPTPSTESIVVTAQRFNTVALISALVLALLFGCYSVIDRKSSLSDGKRIASEIADHTALVAEATLLSTRQLLRAMEALVQPPTLREGPDPAKMRTALLRLKAQSPHVMDLLILDRQGRIQHWTGNGNPPAVTERSYVTAHAQKHVAGVHVTEPLVSKMTGRWIFGVSDALRNDQGELEQILVAIIDVGAFHERLTVPFSVIGTTQALIAEDGMVYARNPDHAAHVGKTVARTQELVGLSASQPALTIVARSQLDQKERILAFRRLNEFPMVAVGTIMVAEMLDDWWWRTLMLSGVWLAAVLVIFVFARRANTISLAQVKLANVDELTGVANRRSIMQAASSLERSAQHAGSLSLLMIDIDHFKSINDRFGHQIGDDVLRQVSDVLRSNIRVTDFLGRYGGEEFLVLMPDTGLEGADQLAEKLRKVVAEQLVRPVSVTVSIGVATRSDADVTLDRTISRADHALYKAKAEGRNRVELAPESLPSLEC